MVKRKMQGCALFEAQLVGICRFFSQKRA